MAPYWRANDHSCLMMKTTFFYSWLVGLFLTAASTQVLASVPQLMSDSEQATAGYFQLSWEGDEGSDYLLQEANDPNFSQFTTLYEGPDTARLVSGRSDGTYYYRIRYRDQAEDANAWSNVTTVEVAHHPLSRAFMFFTLGAIVFIATLTVVVMGNKSSKNQ